MPKTEVLFFQDDNGNAPVLGWLEDLPAKVQDKAIVRVERLAECGHELRRPEADFLRDGIYELRIKHMRVNYRILYFFHEQCAVLAAGIVKEGKVPDKDIDRAVSRQHRFHTDPAIYTYEES